jgi:phosphoribosylformimino-5-aminoimidazole carboxamide ribotide isomerase
LPRARAGAPTHPLLPPPLLAARRRRQASLAASCDEFLVHGVDVEGMQLGIDDELVELLGRWSPIPVTYAGGARTLVRRRRWGLGGSGGLLPTPSTPAKRPPLTGLPPPCRPSQPPQEDLERVRSAGRGRVDITVGSALDIFGGKLAYADVVGWHRAQAAAAGGGGDGGGKSG